MLMLLRLLVTAFDVFALGTAIYSTSLNYYYRCIGQIYRKPACYVNILNENICFVKAFFDKKSNFVKKNVRKWRGGHTPAKIAPAVIGQLRTRYF